MLDTESFLISPESPCKKGGREAETYKQLQFSARFWLWKEVGSIISLNPVKEKVENSNVLQFSSSFCSWEVKGSFLSVIPKKEVKERVPELITSMLKSDGESFLLSPSPSKEGGREDNILKRAYWQKEDRAAVLPMTIKEVPNT
jgi:hypothetical protein